MKLFSKKQANVSKSKNSKINNKQTKLTDKDLKAIKGGSSDNPVNSYEWVMSKFNF